MENHDEAYYAWRDAGIRNATLVHVDAHHDMWPIADGAATTVGNYIFRAMREGIVRDVFWVVPDASFASEENRKSLLRNLVDLPELQLLEQTDSQITADYFGHRVAVCRASDVPACNDVLLDVDVDYFVLPSVSAPEKHEIPDQTPWVWPQGLLHALKSKCSVRLLTVAYSVNGGTTPLQWKHLGEEFRDEYLGETSREKYFAAIRRAWQCRNRGDVEGAENILRVAIQHTPGHPAAYWHLAELLEVRGEFAQAQERYKQAVTHDPKYACVYNNAGPCLEAAGKFDEAGAEYKRMLRLNSTDAQALCGLGRIAAKSKELRSAREWLNRALEIDAENLEAHRALGFVLCELGDCKSAIREFENYFNLLREGRRSVRTPISSHGPGEDFHELSVRVQLAELYRAEGDLSKAEKQLRWLGARRVPNTPISTVRMDHASVLLKQRRFAAATAATLSGMAALPIDGLRAVSKMSRLFASSGGHPIENVVLNVARTGVTFLSGLVTAAILARNLGPEKMGVYSYTLWIAGVLVGLCHFGIPTALSKFIAVQSGNREASGVGKVARKLLKLQVGVIAVVTIVAASVLFLSHSGGPWIFAVLLIAPMALQQAFTNALMGAHDYRKLSWNGALGAVAQVASVAMVAMLGGSLIWFLAAIVASNIFLAMLYGHQSRGVGLLNVAREKTGNQAIGYRQLFLFAGPVAYLVLLDLVVWQRSEVWFLRRYSVWQEIAFYSIAYLMVGRLTDLLVSATSTLLPLQSRAGREGVANIQNQAVCLLQVFVLPICICAGLLGKVMIVAFFGESYAQVLPVLLVLLLSPIAVTITDVSVASIYVMDRQRSLMLPLTFTALLNLALAYLFVPRWGALGAAAANSSAQLAEGLFLLLFSSSILSIRVPWVRLLKIYSAAAFCFAPALVAATRGLAAWAMAIFLICGSIAYTVLMLRTKELNFVARRILPWPAELNANA